MRVLIPVRIRTKARPGPGPPLLFCPFANKSRDPEQACFSNGITEDMITGLSRFRMLHVIARYSSFVFKGHQADMREIGCKPGAEYVVEGSVRRAGNRVGITAQLIKADSGNHFCVERYSLDLQDIVAIFKIS